MCVDEGFSLRVHMTWPGRDATPREHVLICPLTAAGVPVAARRRTRRRPAAGRRKARAANGERYSGGRRRGGALPAKSHHRAAGADISACLRDAGPGW